MKRFCIFFFLLSVSFILVTKNDISKAYSISELENYLNYYKSEVDNGSIEFGNSYAIQQLYSLYSNHYDQFLILNEKLSDCVNPVYRINYNGSNHNIYYKLMDCSSLSIDNNGGISATYTYYKALTDSRGVGNFGTAQSGTNGSETIGNIYNVLYSSNLVDSNMITTLNSSYNYITQRQWTFIVNRGGSLPLYTNNNTYVDAFDIRIGQDWSINNVSLRIYYYDNEDHKFYLNNIVYVLQSTSNTNQYIVRFESQNLFEDETYYIELQYNNNTWRDTETGQRIIKSNNPVSPSGDGGSGNIIVDLTQTNQKLDNINNSINNQTQVIISGDKSIENAIIKAASGDIERDNFWRATYDSLFIMDSGDLGEIYSIMEAYFPSGENNPISIYDTIFGSYTNEPDDFIIRWDDHPLNITWKNGEVLYSGDFIQAGSMNFSAYCRDYDVLRIIKFWINILNTIFIFIGYCFMIYRGIIDILGVVQPEPPAPEHRPIGFGRS